MGEDVELVKSLFKYLTHLESPLRISVNLMAQSMHNTYSFTSNLIFDLIILYLTVNTQWHVYLAGLGSCHVNGFNV